jgi:programmed cell death 6-interacting protein
MLVGRLVQEEIDRALSRVSNVNVHQNSSVVDDLRRLIESVNTIKAERETIECELNDVDINDVRVRFTAALQREQHVNENILVNNELERIYASIREYVNESMAKQENLVGNIVRAHDIFRAEKRTDTSSHNRQEMLTSLACAHDAYQQLMSNVTDSIKVCRGNRTSP